MLEKHDAHRAFPRALVFQNFLHTPKQRSEGLRVQDIDPAVMRMKNKDKIYAHGSRRVPYCCQESFYVTLVKR